MSVVEDEPGFVVGVKRAYGFSRSSSASALVRQEATDNNVNNVNTICCLHSQADTSSVPEHSLTTTDAPGDQSRRCGASTLNNASQIQRYPSSTANSGKRLALRNRVMSIANLNASMTDDQICPSSANSASGRRPPCSCAPLTLISYPSILSETSSVSSRAYSPSPLVTFSNLSASMPMPVPVAVPTKSNNNSSNTLPGSLSSSLGRSPSCSFIEYDPDTSRLSYDLLNRVLEKRVDENDSNEALDNCCSLFHQMPSSSFEPQKFISSLNLLSRSNACFVAAMYYMDKLAAGKNKYKLTSSNMRRMFVVCLLLAEKYFEDHPRHMVMYCQAAGVNKTEMNRMELVLLAELNFDLNISRDAFERYQMQLLEESKQC